MDSGSWTVRFEKFYNMNNNFFGKCHYDDDLLESWPPNVDTMYFHKTKIFCDPHRGLFLGLFRSGPKTVRFKKFYNVNINFNAS